MIEARASLGRLLDLGNRLFCGYYLALKKRNILHAYPHSEKLENELTRPNTKLFILWALNKATA